MDLTADIAREQGLHVDMEGFNQFMQQQREQSQAASQFTTDYHANFNSISNPIFMVMKKKLAAKIIALIQEGKEVNTLNKGLKGGLVLDHTPFYAESGGQVGDKGMSANKEFVFELRIRRKRSSYCALWGGCRRNLNF